MMAVIRWKATLFTNKVSTSAPMTKANEMTTFPLTVSTNFFFLTFSNGNCM